MVKKEYDISELKTTSSDQIDMQLLTQKRGEGEGNNNSKTPKPEYLLQPVHWNCIGETDWGDRRRPSKLAFTLLISLCLSLLALPAW